MKKTPTYKISKKIIFEKNNFRYVIYLFNKEFYYSLNIFGSFIFDKIIKKYSKEEILGDIIKHYLVSKNKARLDLEEFIKTLIDLEIISKI